MFFQILHKIFLYNCSQLNSGSVLAHTSKGTCFKICILHTKNARGRPLWQITTYTWKLWVLCFVVQCCASFERGCFPFKIFISLLSFPAPILAGVAELTFVSNRIALHSDLISFKYKKWTLSTTTSQTKGHLIQYLAGDQCFHEIVRDWVNYKGLLVPELLSDNLFVWISRIFIWQLETKATTG